MSVMYDMSFFFFKKKTAYEVRISDWSSDVCSSDLHRGGDVHVERDEQVAVGAARRLAEQVLESPVDHGEAGAIVEVALVEPEAAVRLQVDQPFQDQVLEARLAIGREAHHLVRSEEHTSELQSLMRISYAVFCLKKKNTKPHHNNT